VQYRLHLFVGKRAHPAFPPDAGSRCSPEWRYSAVARIFSRIPEPQKSLRGEQQIKRSDFSDSRYAAQQFLFSVKVFIAPDEFAYCQFQGFQLGFQERYRLSVGGFHAPVDFLSQEFLALRSALETFYRGDELFAFRIHEVKLLVDDFGNFRELDLVLVAHRVFGDLLRIYRVALASGKTSGTLDLDCGDFRIVPTVPAQEHRQNSGVDSGMLEDHECVLHHQSFL